MTRIFHRLFLWKWIPCQAVESVLCLLFRPKTVHWSSTKNAYTSEKTFLALVLWVEGNEVIVEGNKNMYISKRIEYILEGNLLEKSVKRPFCCTVSILQVYFRNLCYITFWALEHHFIENLKLMLKENQIMK